MTDVLLDWLVHPIWTAVIGVPVATVVAWICGSDKVVRSYRAATAPIRFSVHRFGTRFGSLLWLVVWPLITGISYATERFVGFYYAWVPILVVTVLSVVFAIWGLATVMGRILRLLLSRLDDTTKLSLAPQFIRRGATRVYREVILDDVLTEWKSANILTRLTLLISLLSIVTLVGEAIWSAWFQRRQP